MSENKEENRTEQPTPYKQREARRKGMVLKSMDVLSFASVTGASLAAIFFFHDFAMHLLISSRNLFTTISAGRDSDLLALSSQFMSSIFADLLPSATLLVLTIISASIFQSGLVFSTEPLKPDIQRLNPVSGFKKLFSLKIFFELLKTCIKVIFFCVILSIIFWTLIQDTTSKGALSLSSLNEIVHWYGVRLWIGIFILMLFFAGLDYFLSARIFNNEMKMSRNEIKEENKRQEGDPTIRRRMREIRREFATKSKSLSSVKDADFILTNPTHLAIAIRYQREIIDAPVMLAKGAGQQAKKIREIAAQHNIPIMERRKLARQIYFNTKIGHAIDSKYFVDIARIMHRAGLFRKKI